MKWSQGTPLEGAEPGSEPRSLWLWKTTLALTHKEASFPFASLLLCFPESKIWFSCQPSLLSILIHPSLSKPLILPRYLLSLSMAGPTVPFVATPVSFLFNSSESGASKPMCILLWLMPGEPYHPSTVDLPLWINRDIAMGTVGAM